MIFAVLSIITQATSDCVIRAKHVTMNASEEQCPASKPVHQLDGKMIAMAMGYYCKVVCPFNGYHELFYNGLLYILFGVVGLNITTIANNVHLFKGFYYKTNVTGGLYALDMLMIDLDADDEMCLVKFGENNVNDSKMDE